MWLENGRIYKSQPKYNTDNEHYFLKILEDSGYVPRDVRREDIELISMEYIRPQQVSDPTVFHEHFSGLLQALESVGIRHGDLTDYSVLVNNNRPIVIDFAESRWLKDPIWSKRPQSDRELLYSAMRKICPIP